LATVDLKMLESKDKTAFRKQAIAYRAALSEAAYAAFSTQIVAYLKEVPEFQTASTIMVYYPDVQRREVDIRPLFHLWHHAGKTLLLPYITSMVQGHMQAVLFNPKEELRPNRWGILEPQHAHSISNQAIDAVLVPGLAADKHGTRLGYGKGFYDRFLKPLSVPVVLATYHATIKDVLPSEIHDYPVNLIISEEGAFRIS